MVAVHVPPKCCMFHWPLSMHQGSGPGRIALFSCVVLMLCLSVSQPQRVCPSSGSPDARRRRSFLASQLPELLCALSHGPLFPLRPSPGRGATGMVCPSAQARRRLLSTLAASAAREATRWLRRAAGRRRRFSHPAAHGTCACTQMAISSPAGGGPLSRFPGVPAGPTPMVLARVRERAAGSRHSHGLFPAAPVTSSATGIGLCSGDHLPWSARAVHHDDCQLEGRDCAGDQNPQASGWWSAGLPMPFLPRWNDYKDNRTLKQEWRMEIVVDL